MDYLTAMRQIELRQTRNLAPQSRTPVNHVRYLVSGCDLTVHQTIMSGIISAAESDCHRQIIIVDDMDGMLSLDDTRNYRTKRLGGYDPLSGDSAQLRKFLSSAGYSEQQKAAVQAYLEFIRYLEQLQHPENGEEQLSREILANYSSTILVEACLNRLKNQGRISEMQQLHLLSKYGEVSAAAADFEQLLSACPSGTASCIRLHPGELLLVPLDEDPTSRHCSLQHVSQVYGNSCSKPIVLIFTHGLRDCNSIFELLNALPATADVHLFTSDFFSLSESETELRRVLGRFQAHFFTRHEAMDSCAKVEYEAGEIEVRKVTYTETYDLRWKTSSPMDRLFNRNKTEAFAHGAPINEPKYRKEYINQLPDGMAICCYMGNAMVLRIR